MPKVVVHASQPTSITYYNAPPALGGIRQRLSVAQFEDKVGIKYTESILALDDRTAALLSEYDREISPTTQRIYLPELLKLLSKPFDGLAVAFINQQVGHGVFAERDIPFNTVIGCYSGVVKPISELRSSDYIMSINDQLAVDASEFRGLGGFMQHLVTDPQQDIEERKDYFRNPQNLARILPGFDADPQGMTRQVEQRLRDGTVDEQELTKIAKNCTPFSKTEVELASLKSTSSSSGKIPNLATGNVVQYFIRCQDSYVIILVTKHAIKKHEMVGLSYLGEYWKKQNISPRYFSRFGQVIPLSFYRKVSNLRLELAAKTGPVEVINSLQPFLDDVIANRPVFLGEGYGDVSIYDLRLQLQRHNAVPPEFGELELNTVGLAVKEALALKKISATVKLFWQTPIKVEKASAAALSAAEQTLDDHKVDLVCRANDDTSFVALKKFLSSSGSQARFFESTREVVLEDVNDNETRETRKNWISSTAFSAPAPKS